LASAKYNEGQSVPELQFKGKEFVYNHHLTVPFRPLEMQADKSVGEPRLDGNLIVHGDNLHALKALLPMYAGKVDCIYIDPPYNTGNEDWVYNDAVNAPMIREWLSNEVGIDDGLRHDKWACMMWPRLKLLHELCSDEALIFVSIDDNEMHTLRFLMDEVFGEKNFLGQVTVEVNPKGRGMKDSDFAKTHEYLIVYQADKRDWLIGSKRDDEKEAKDFPLVDADGRYRELELRNTHRQFGRHNRPNLYFPIYGLADGSVSLEPGGGGAECLPLWPDGYEGC
jgi:adenine-specific DNA-methyltransferase